MKNLVVVLIAVVLWSCSDSNLNGDLTGNELNYTLFSGSEFGYQGAVTFQEKTDGTVRIVINVEGPEGESVFPAHLHFGSFDTPDAELAALLTPVNARTGESVTDLRFLSNDVAMKYSDFENFNGHIKVHLDDGANQDVILAFGNIGSNKLMFEGDAAQCEGPN